MLYDCAVWRIFTLENEEAVSSAAGCRPVPMHCAAPYRAVSGGRALAGDGESVRLVAPQTWKLYSWKDICKDLAGFVSLGTL